MLLRRCLIFLLPILAYAGLIFFFSSQSSLPPTPGHGFDKLAHFLEYFGLAFLIARAFMGFGSASGRAILLAFVLSVAFGVSDEIQLLSRWKRDITGIDFDFEFIFDEIRKVGELLPANAVSIAFHYNVLRSIRTHVQNEVRI